MGSLVSEWRLVLAQGSASRGSSESGSLLMASRLQRFSIARHVELHLGTRSISETWRYQVDVEVEHSLKAMIQHGGDV